MGNKKDSHKTSKDFISGIFSVKNEGTNKVISVLGAKIKIKSPKLSEIKEFEELKSLITFLKEDNAKLKIQVNTLLSHIVTVGQQLEVSRIQSDNIKSDLQALCSQVLSMRCEKFANDNTNYINNPAKSKKRRLFLTTGNLSLLNNLTIIKQLDEPNCEDILFVYSQFNNPTFDNTCKKMSALHNFEKIYIESNWNKEHDFLAFFMDNKLFDIDEIYFSNQYQFIQVAQNLYPNTKWFLTDEGCAALVAREYMDYDRVEKIYYNNYLDKLDFLGLSRENYSKVAHLNLEIFKNVARQCSQMFPVDLTIDKNDKTILFCGMWWENAGLPQEEFFEMQNSTIKKLQSMGYKVIFKPHPRDNRDYVSELGVTAIQTSLPLECYDFDIVGAVSLASTVTLQSYGVSGIPSFVMMPVGKLHPKKDAKWVDSIIKYMLTEYTAPIDILYSVDPKNYSKAELKNVLAQKCADYINSKPLLSQNSELIEFAKQCGYEFKATEKEPVCI